MSGIADEIKARKESHTKVRKETKSARRPLPENLESIINAITPEELVGYEDEICGRRSRDSWGTSL